MQSPVFTWVAVSLVVAGAIFIGGFTYAMSADGREEAKRREPFFFASAIPMILWVPLAVAAEAAYR